MFEVRITPEKLHELRMLTDWKLRELGFDPDSVTAACEKVSISPRYAYAWPSPKGPTHPSCY